MARLHTQTSNWNNAGQANRNAPKANVPVNTAPSSPQEINVVTKVVSEYDPNNVTMARTIVQPIAIVPYNTTEQPLYQYLPENYYGGDANMADYDNDEQGRKVKDWGGAKTGVSGIKIGLILLSLIYIAVAVVGKFVDITYLKFDASRSGLEIILTVTSAFGQGIAIKDRLFPVLLAAHSLFVLLILLGSLIGIKKGVNVFTKILAVLSLLCIGGFGYLIFDAKLGFGYGFYAAAAITVLITLLALIGKRKR